MKFKTASAIALTVLLPLSLSSQSRVVSLASVQADGMLVPFATFDGANWVTPWPEPGRSPVDARESPTSEELEALATFWKTKGLAVPAVWQLWSSGAARPSTIKVQRRESFEAGCERQVGLMTDFRHDRKDSTHIASNGPITIQQPINLLTANGGVQGWQDMVRRILQDFPRQENRAIAEWQKPGRSLKLSGTALAARPIQLRALYAYRDGRRRIVYFEGVREYGIHVGEPGCNGKTRVSGWAISENGGRPVVAGAHAVVTDCDEMEAYTAVPAGVIRGLDDLVWILNKEYYESQAFLIVSIGRTVKELLKTWGGGCAP